MLVLHNTPLLHTVEDDFQNMDHTLIDLLPLVTHDGVTEYPPWV